MRGAVGWGRGKEKHQVKGQGRGKGSGEGRRWGRSRVCRSGDWLAGVCRGEEGVGAGWVRCGAWHALRSVR